MITSIAYASIMYRRRSTMKPNVLIGLMSDSFSASSRNVMGYPTLIVMSMSPDIRDPNGNWNAARIKMKMKIPPKIVANLFVGISCFGSDFPMIWLNDSLPAYL